MSRELLREQLLAFLETIRRPDVRLEVIRESDNLVRSGLIDSLAILQIIVFLESDFGVDFAATGVDPGQLGTVARILDLMEQHSQ
jgi:acyl carrier protein